MSNKITIIVVVFILLTALICLYVNFRGDDGFIINNGTENVGNVDVDDNYVELNNNPDSIIEREIIESSEIEDTINNWYSDLPNPALIIGKVIKNDGSPISNAKIFTIIDPIDTAPAPEINEFIDNSHSFITTTDDGCFEISARPDNRYFLLAMKEGYVPMIFPSHAGESRVVVLSKSLGAFKGRVVDGLNNNPIKDVKIAIQYSNGYFKATIRETSDIDGKFEFKECPQVINLITLKDDNYEELRINKIPFECLNENEIKLFPIKHIIVNILIRDAGDNSVIEKAIINNAPSIVNANGIHQIKHPINKDELLISVNGYCNKSILTDWLKEKDLFDVKLLPPCNFYGIIEDYKGNPVQNVIIEPFFDESDIVLTKKEIAVSSKSGYDGSFVLCNLPIEKEFNIRLKKGDSFERIYRGFSFAKCGEYIGKLIYDFNGKILGEVISDNGIRIPGAWVMVIDPNGSMSRTLTDKSGLFSIDCDTYNRLFVTRYGFYNFDEKYENGNSITIAPNKEFKKTIILKKSESISGKVVDVNNRPVAGSIFVVRAKKKRKFRGSLGVNMTDINGYFILMGLEYGKEYYIKSYRNNVPRQYSFNDNDIYKGGDNDVVMSITETGLIFGKICNNGGELIRCSKLHHSNKVELCVEKGHIADMHKYPGMLITNGYYSLTLEPNTYSILVKSDEYIHDTIFVELSTNDILNIPLVLYKK